MCSAIVTEDRLPKAVEGFREPAGSRLVVLQMVEGHLRNI
jgi:hypothetical protein